MFNTYIYIYLTLSPSVDCFDHQKLGPQIRTNDLSAPGHLSSEAPANDEHLESTAWKVR